MTVVPYNRRAAVAYAHRWAYSRNPQYYNYDGLGGDCTNYVSQCLYAGSKVMNDTPTFGWYYYTPNQKAPAWTGVEYFRNFLLRKEESVGPFGEETKLAALRPGDFVQLKLDKNRFSHTPVVVAVGRRPTLWNTLVAAHSADADYRVLASYPFEEIRFLHILGVRKE
ncbi:amidase [Pseudoflavonifractor sp. 524-17]|uniref:amidase domain-containing protein n=1 Tax=Pseudoflavonifractor sp. 524-17 TaxID=2304577 RepID=UPI001379BBF3|nr:amidase domain-containing protein [Pseudoflavonifractor sp. 524-17]NCE64194.1 amidase [Pseudoflavonifractor sp. 524-17]